MALQTQSPGPTHQETTSNYWQRTRPPAKPVIPLKPMNPRRWGCPPGPLRAPQSGRQALGQSHLAASTGTGKVKDPPRILRLFLEPAIPPVSRDTTAVQRRTWRCAELDLYLDLARDRSEWHGEAVNSIQSPSVDATRTGRLHSSIDAGPPADRRDGSTGTISTALRRSVIQGPGVCLSLAHSRRPCDSSFSPAPPLALLSPLLTSSPSFPPFVALLLRFLSQLNYFHGEVCRPSVTRCFTVDLVSFHPCLSFKPRWIILVCRSSTTRTLFQRSFIIDTHHEVLDRPCWRFADGQCPGEAARHRVEGMHIIPGYWPVACSVASHRTF